MALVLTRFLQPSTSTNGRASVLPAQAVVQHGAPGIDPTEAVCGPRKARQAAQEVRGVVARARPLTEHVRGLFDGLEGGLAIALDHLQPGTGEQEVLPR